MKKEKFCIFCGKNHKKIRPKLCEAKGVIMRSWLRALGAEQSWKFFHAVERGIIDLDGDAMRLVKNQKAS